MISLIASENGLAVAAALFAIVLCGLLAERTELGAKLSAPLIALGGGMLLANIRVLPFESPAYGFVVTYLVPAAIPLLLLNADLKRIFRETGQTLIAFLAGAAGTATGAALGFLLIDVGPETAKVAGILSAAFIGGSFNFVAVSQAVAVEDATLLAAAATAQGVAGIVYLGVLIMAAGMPVLARTFPNHRQSPAADPPAGGLSGPGAPASSENNTFDASTPRPVNVPACVSFTLVVCAVSQGAAHLVGAPQFGILIITIVTVAMASFAPALMRKLAGGEAIGLMLLYVFIAGIGAQSNIWLLAGATTMLLGFLAVLLATHVLFVLVAGRLFRLTLPEVVTGSNACALGAATAAAIAAGRRWHALVTPGILCGILGYVLANFIGVGLASTLG